MRRAKETMDSTPRVTDGPGLMRRYAQLDFENCPLGGDVRRRQLQDLSRFLEFSSEELGFPSSWMPLSKAKRADLVGSRPTTSAKTQRKTVPLLPGDFQWLLERILEDGRQELWLATALAGFFGLQVRSQQRLRQLGEGSLTT